MIKLLLILILVGSMVLSSCKKTSPRRENVPPIALAGRDITIILPQDSVELAGIGIDPDGAIISYQWSKVSGPASLNIVSPNMAVTMVNGLVEGAYEFQLKVTDDGGLSGASNVRVFVRTVTDPCNGCWDY